MARDYDYERDDPRDRQRPQKKWYNNNYIWIAGAIILIIIIVFASGKISDFRNKDGGNTTSQPTQEDQLVSYIIAQQESGIPNEEIVTKLQLSGYTDSDIQRGFDLSDPVVQYLKKEMERGVTKQQLVEALIKQGYTPEQIQAKFDILEPRNSFGETLKKNWWVIALAIIAYLIYAKYTETEKQNRAPKVYTLEECREYAEQILKEKEINFIQCRQYRNRPEIRQYKYVFEEPEYPEFNSHRPWGHKAGLREYYFLAVGYDKQLVDFQRCMQDSLIHQFLYGNPKGFETRGNAEYAKIRAGSEALIPDQPQPGSYNQDNYSNRAYNPRSSIRNRSRPRRYSPGPIEGYEDS